MTDPRLRAGIAHFDAGEFFDAHEVWEALWHDCPANDRRFVQSLIQAAVSLYHWVNGNTAGAATLFHSGRPTTRRSTTASHSPSSGRPWKRPSFGTTRRRASVWHRN